MPVVCRVQKNAELRRFEGIPPDLPALLADPATRFWLDIDTIDVPTLEDMGRRFGFHPLAIEDCHHAIQRPKIDEYPGHIFFSFHAVDESREGELCLREIDGFLGSNFLVTVHEEPSPEIAALVARCEKNVNVLERGMDQLFHALLDRMVDTHFPLLDRIEERIDSAEDRIFGSPDRGVLEELFQIKKELLAVRRIVGPQREILGQLGGRELPVIAPATRPYLRDVQDHLLRLTELVETYRDLVNGAMDAYRAEIQQRLNEVMKILAVIGTVSLPLTLIAGLWGMNMARIPWASDPNGFWYIVALLVALAAAMLGLFRWARWL
jgi:magnesium transporter